MADWISTNDMLPEKGVYVLVLHDHSKYPDVFRYDDYGFRKNSNGETEQVVVGQAWLSPSNVITDSVHHWMPIPDSPFEE